MKTWLKWLLAVGAFLAIVGTIVLTLAFNFDDSARNATPAMVEGAKTP